jgi:hypothetical protein
MKKEWFYNWFIRHVHDTFLILSWHFFTDEANFNFLEYINLKQQVL